MSRVRLIDADELKTAFPCGESVRTECVRATIDHMPTIQPEPHWIPLSKKRPPQHQEIWITDVYGDVEVVYRGDGRLWLSNGDNGYYFEDEIIAWMPANVPSPYQPEEDKS